MAKIYFRLVVKGAMELKDVPHKFQKTVRELLINASREDLLRENTTDEG